MSRAEAYRPRGSSARALAADVEAAVERGALAPGEALASVRDLAVAAGVSPTTVTAALRELRARGIVVTRERRRTQIADRPPLVARPAGSQAPGARPGVRDLSLGNPDPRLLPSLPEALRRVDLSEAHLYGEATALPALVAAARAEFAPALGRRLGVAVASGALDGIERVLAVHLRPGDAVGVEDPGYPNVLDLLRVLGLRALPIRLDADGVTPAALAAALAAGAAAVVLTPRAQNPTGAAWTARRASELAAVLDRHPDVLVVEDDHAGAVAGAPARTVTNRPSRRRFAVARSVSKALGPDLRVAVVAADPGTLSRVEGRRILGPGWVSHLLQQLAADLLVDPSARATVAAARDAYAARRTALVDALARRGIAASGRSGLNVWVPVPEEGPVLSGLLAAGWAVRAGEPFRTASAPAVRITVAGLAPAEADRLAADLARILDPPGAAARPA